MKNHESKTQLVKTIHIPIVVTSNANIIKKLCKSNKLWIDRAVMLKNPLYVKCDLQRVFSCNHCDLTSFLIIQRKKKWSCWKSDLQRVFSMTTLWFDKIFNFSGQIYRSFDFEKGYSCVIQNLWIFLFENGFLGRGHFLQRFCIAFAYVKSLCKNCPHPKKLHLQFHFWLFY